MWKPLAVFLRSLVGTIPPRDLTATRIVITEMRIRDYWKVHGQLPASLYDLKPLAGRDSAVTDGWGAPIAYEARGPVAVTLSSARAGIVRAFDVGDRGREDAP